ncbi:MAG TPA: hypothetical protein VFW94_10130, partial [Candidatus Acidoferrales bacterium]|nr:hypothetical protein [Candidatus Acidoferrales bacterium]
AYFAPDQFTGVTAADPENVCGAAGQCTSNGLADYHPYGTMVIGGQNVNVYGTNAVEVEQHAGYSNYNAMEVMWSKQTGRLAFNTSFLWSKSLGFQNANINPFDQRANYTILNIDRPYVWNTSYSFDLGKAYHGDNKFVGGAANGWTIAGFTTWQKGADMQSQVSENFGMNFVYSDGSNLTQRSFFGTDAAINVQPAMTCNPTSGLSGSQFVKLSCLAPPSVPTGTAIVANGPTQLPYIAMPAFFDSDLALYKTFHVTERQTIEFRVTAQNFLNHPLVGYSNNNPITLKYSLDKTSGQYTYTGSTPAAAWGITDTKFEPVAASYGRILQFGLKYSF